MKNILYVLGAVIALYVAYRVFIYVGWLLLILGVFLALGFVAYRWVAARQG
jgi:hypothetical protein